MNRQHSLISVCVACGKTIMEGDVNAAPIDGFWACSSDCTREYQEASAGWSAEKLSRVKQWQEQAVRDAKETPLREQTPFWILVVINVLIIIATAVVAGQSTFVSGVAPAALGIGIGALVVFNVIFQIAWRMARRK